MYYGTNYDKFGGFALLASPNGYTPASGLFNNDDIESVQREGRNVTA